MEVIRAVVSALLLGPLLLHGELAVPPAPQAHAVLVGGRLITFPSPAGFVRSDGVNARWDATTAAAVAATNRRLIVFSTPGDLEALKAGKPAASERGFNCQIVRSIETQDIGEKAFDQSRSEIKAGLDGTRLKLQEEMSKLAGDAGRSLHEQHGVDAVLTLSDTAILGYFQDTPTALGFTVAMKVQMADPPHTDKSKRVAAVMMVPVNGRLLSLYATSDYQTETDRQWAEKAVAAWRDAIVAANPRVVSEAFGGLDLSRVWRAALIGAIVGGLIHLARKIWHRRQR